MKRIIVEGVDGSGKTSLINNIVDRIQGIRVVPGFKHSGEPDYTTWLRHELMQDESRSVPMHDRFFYSELVYGPIFRQSLAISAHIYEETTPHLRKHALLIYCRPPLSTLTKSAKVEPQMQGVHDHLPELYDEYEQLMAQESEAYGSRFVLWDFTKDYWINYIGPRIRSYLESGLEVA